MKSTSGEVGGGVRGFGQHAGPRLVHDLDALPLDAGEDQLPVRAGNLVLRLEPEAIRARA